MMNGVFSRNYFIIPGLRQYFDGVDNTDEYKEVEACDICMKQWNIHKLECSHKLCLTCITRALENKCPYCKRDIEGENLACKLEEEKEKRRLEKDAWIARQLEMEIVIDSSLLYGIYDEFKALSDFFEISQVPNIDQKFEIEFQQLSNLDNLNKFYKEQFLRLAE